MTLTKEWQKIASSSSVTFGATTSHLELYAKYNSQDVGSNTTNYSIRLNLVKDTGGYIGDYTGASASVYGDGIGTKNVSLGTGNFVTQELINVSGNVSHNDDGSKTVTINGSVYFSAWGYGISIGNQYVDLPKIPRASTVACSSPFIGDTATITIDKKVDTFTSTVTYKIGTLTGTIATKTTNTTLSLATSSLKSQIYDLIPNAKEIQGTIYCETYNGNTKIGDTQSTTFNLYAKESECKPTISATVVDTNTTCTNLTGSNTKLIKYISKPKVTITATPKNSATIKSYSINLNDGQTSTTNGTTFNTIGSNKIIVNAVDSRGYSNPTEVSLNMINYVQLHIDSLSVQRTESTSNEAILNMNGAYFNGSFATNKANTLTITYQYKKSTDTSWQNGGTIVPTKTGNTFKFANFSLGSIYDSESEYQFKFTIKDLLMTVISGDNDGVLEKGQEVMAIGDGVVYFNGEFYINDKTFLNLTYPVGSIYTSVNSTSPATLFGGTWERITGKFLLGAIDGNATYGPGKTGGESTHKLTINEIPSHNHSIKQYRGSAQWANGYLWARASGEDGNEEGGQETNTGSAGGGLAHNNMPPFLAVYIWKRTA